MLLKLHVTEAKGHLKSFSGENVDLVLNSDGTYAISGSPGLHHRGKYLVYKKNMKKTCFLAVTSYAKYTNGYFDASFSKRIYRVTFYECSGEKRTNAGSFAAKVLSS